MDKYTNQTIVLSPPAKAGVHIYYMATFYYKCLDSGLRRNDIKLKSYFSLMSFFSYKLTSSPNYFCK